MFTVVIHSLQQSRHGSKPKCPLADEWIEKMWYIYSMKYNLVITKKKILLFAGTWIDREYHTK